MAAGVGLRGLGHTYGNGHVVLRDIELDVPPGEIVAILGPSGCGKSTLLRLVAGLEAPATGEVLVDGHAVRGIDERCAVVFQEPRLLPWRDLAGNVALGLPKGTGRADGNRVVRHWLDVVGLAGFHGHRPRQVSGGMAQRTALARALAREPGVLLLDEPFAALDALTRLRMQDLLADVQRGAGTTVLLVTHDVDEALHLANRVVLLGDPHAATTHGDSLGDDPLGDGALGGRSPGATVVTVLDVPHPRPRDRAHPELAALRADLLERLGVPRPVPAQEAAP
ncbi:ABC transporter ATP-binding protein [Nonomuraea monospora]|uniref:ABC transporter ATP-binding protein n=1 Tax=Nonomuraea monospora TaxID=568818 RepID=A0ABN3CBH6_9ACTN